MKPQNFPEYKNWLKENFQELTEAKKEYLNIHPDLEIIDFPNSFWFKVYHDRLAVHYAIIKKEENYVIYFINIAGIAFDKLEFKNIKVAKRLLRKNKFVSCNNQKPPYLPLLPIYIKLNIGRKTAPYSKGNLWIVQERFKNAKNPKSAVAPSKNYDIWIRLLLLLICYIICALYVFFATK